MNGILELRELLRRLYRRWDSYLIAGGKFLAAFSLFFYIRLTLGGQGPANHPLLLTILSLFCSFLPANAAVLIAAALILLQLSAVSLAAAVTGGIFLLIFLLIYFGWIPDQGYVLMLTPVFFALHLPAAVPLVFGLMAGPGAAAAIVFGGGIFYLIRDLGAGTAGETAGGAFGIALLDELQLLVMRFLNDREMMLNLLVAITVFFVVYLVHRLPLRYAWYLGIGAGAVSFLILTALGLRVMELEMDLPVLILGTAIAVVLALILEIFCFSLDYKRTRRVQFEDDEYYYYVTAVPKLNASAKQED